MLIVVQPLNETRDDLVWFDRRSGVPVVSVSEYGLGFNRAAIEMLGYPKAVRLGLSKKRRLIAVQALKAGTDANGFEFASRERDGYVRINSRDFIRLLQSYHPGLKFEQARRCLARWDDEAGLMYVDLDHVVDKADKLGK